MAGRIRERHQRACCARLSWRAFARAADDKAVTADFDTWGHLSDRSGAVVGPWPSVARIQRTSRPADPNPRDTAHWTSALEGTPVAACSCGIWRPLPANQSWEQVDLAALWNWREEGATVNRAVDRDGDATVENRPQLRIKFAQPCEQLTDGRGLDLELRRAASL